MEAGQILLPDNSDKESRMELTGVEQLRELDGQANTLHHPGFVLPCSWGRLPEHSISDSQLFQLTSQSCDLHLLPGPP